jgi:D-alanine-D-alanine ligase-like ATP-grasp enzyme
VRICLLTHQDLDAEDLGERDWPCDPRPFLPDDEWQVAPLYERKTSVKQVEALIEQGFDLYFNLCEAPSGDPGAGIEVVKTLEKHGVPFVGPTSRFFDPTRLQMKRACRRVGILTPRYAVVRDEEEADEVLDKLRFPLIVKNYRSYASIDLSRHSRVRTEAGLRRQLRKILSRHGAALVEEFIEGDECTVLVAENPKDPESPITYTPVQYRFPDGETFKHERLKWVDHQGLVAFPVPDDALDARLRDESARFFVELDGSSFARCDIRVAADGTPYMLEINPNCGIYFEEQDYGGADLCLTFDPAGHAGFTRQLVKAAFARHSR